MPKCRYWYVCKMENMYMNQSNLCASQHSSKLRRNCVKAFFADASQSDSLGAATVAVMQFTVIVRTDAIMAATRQHGIALEQAWVAINFLEIH